MKAPKVALRGGALAVDAWGLSDLSWKSERTLGRHSRSQRYIFEKGKNIWEGTKNKMPT